MFESLSKNVRNAYFSFYRVRRRYLDVVLLLSAISFFYVLYIVCTKSMNMLNRLWMMNKKKMTNNTNSYMCVYGLSLKHIETQFTYYVNKYEFI